MCGSQETAKHFLIYCDTFNDIRDTTINTLDVAFDVDILLKDCPLYSDDINRRIFPLMMQSFIIQSYRFSWIIWLIPEINNLL